MSAVLLLLLVASLMMPLAPAQAASDSCITPARLTGGTCTFTCTPDGTAVLIVAGIGSGSHKCGTDEVLKCESDDFEKGVCVKTAGDKPDDPGEGKCVAKPGSVALCITTDGDVDDLIDKLIEELPEWAQDIIRRILNGKTSLVFRGRANVDTGLHFPHVAPGVTSQWSLAAPDVASAPPTFCVAIGQDVQPASDCEIEASGLIGPVKSANNTDLGAWCGLSRGREGDGSLDLIGSGDSPRTVTLHDLTWFISAGSSIMLVGRWDDSTLNEEGDLTAIVQVSGTNDSGQSLAQACSNPNGADSFDVSGIAVLGL